MGGEVLALNGYRRERGLLWPAWDERCAELTFAEISGTLPQVLAHVRARDVVVQAGGNCGPLVRELAPAFGAVYTFEPDPMNFVALVANTAEFPNVYRCQAALGSERRRVSLAQGDRKFPNNCGALYVAGDGVIPTLRIDDLGLDRCDLILLDIEGAERSALVGAIGTVTRFRPVVVIESKGLDREFYGEEAGAAERWLKEIGYARAAKVKHDLIMVYERGR